MKKLFCTLLCAGLMAVLLGIPAFAAQTEAPAQKQGDFYVLINGAYVTFSDAVPQIKENRSCLPFAAVFEQLGFPQEAMTWDGETGTVTATKPDVTYTALDGEVRQGDLTVTLTLGSHIFSVQYEGDTTAGPHGEAVQIAYDFTTEIAPYVDPATNRTYVPFGLVADALGYRVGWDAQQGTVIIDDVDAILAANTATYQLMDQYLAYAQALSQGNQKVSGKYALNFGTESSYEGIISTASFDLGGTYSMITADSTALQLTTDLTMDLAMETGGVDFTDLMMGEQAGLFPMSLDLELRGDLDSGAFYLQSAALAQLMGQPGMASVWYKLDLGALFDQASEQLGMDYAGLLRLSKEAQSMSFAEYLSSALKLIPLTDASCTTSQVLDIINALCADSAFTKSGSTYVNKLDLDEYLEGTYLTFTLYTSGGKVNGCGMDFTADVEGEAALSMAVQMKDKKMSLRMDVEADDGYDKVSLSMTMDGTYQSTSSKPATQPPAGAVIIDLNELAGSYVPMPLE